MTKLGKKVFFRVDYYKTVPKLPNKPPEILMSWANGQLNFIRANVRGFRLGYII